ncbi:hypothetical protein SUGI_0054360 [Cryptomeria japonica]|uniref:uncharacterized protein LOC131065353 n=1 Tax=Cryptomeria japonica TaxID=3369 RepID=UPI002408C0B9|nr:uncharacterized protein LOC131065353 [Cryptomeria japonica]GLJ06970.1 hypothetical protein SUGI_0054360 [Cryptomeria japonica]
MEETMKVPMGPPSAPVTLEDNNNEKSNSISCSVQPYAIPPWSEIPPHPYYIELVKDGVILDNLNVSQKGAYMFGRSDQCDFVLEHPTISRYHAVLQYKGNGDAFLYDLGSTHGSFVNKIQVKPKVYQELYVGDVLRFGHSSRLYIFQGPTELMTKERLTKGRSQSLSGSHSLEEMDDMEASLLRAKREAELADGISWGMMEDAIEEDTKEEDEEVTWETYKGELTEKQNKTRDKIIKRNEKVANLKKEIDAIQAKEIAQGGLTQGQQTQIARNEIRIQQIAEELESLEETLNESIQESIGARSGRVGPKKKEGVVDEDEDESDSDEFYDRTKKGTRSGHMEEKQQAVETAETLLEKKENIARDIENTIAALQAEEPGNLTENGRESLESEDPLDAFMKGLSSQIVKDKTTRLQKKLEKLQSEMDRIVFLLKIADPTGEVCRKQEPKLCSSTTFQAGQLALGSAGKPIDTQFCKDKKNPIKLQRGDNAVGVKNLPLTAVVDGPSRNEKSSIGGSDEEVKSTSGVPNKEISAVTKKQWLGAVHNTEDNVHNQGEISHPENAFDSSEFVGYKERKKVLPSTKEDRTSKSILEDAEGLVILKPKEMNCTPDPIKIRKEDNKNENVSSNTGVDAETAAEDAVALLLRHKRGLATSDKQDQIEEEDITGKDESAQKKKTRRLGPEKPAFLEEDCTHYDAWVPPQGQTGDGRTSLNDKYGY